MRRREFMALVGGAVTWPCGALAQQPAKLPIIGYLGATTPDVAGHRTAALLERLRELGWIDDQTAKVEIRWAEGRTDRAAEIAAEFVRLKVDVIVTSGVPNIVAAKQTAPNTPIVFAIASDPIGAGLVSSLARPGGNITGLSNQSGDLAGKRVDLLRGIIPNLRRLAILANAGNPDSTLEVGEFKTAAAALGLDVIIPEVRRSTDIVPAFEALNGHVQALYVTADPLINTNRIRIQTLAMAARLPAIYNAKEFVEIGGLMSYGPNFEDMFRRAAELTDKILRGAKPSELPVEQPTKFELVINLTTAKALGLSIPESFLSLADQQVE
jgi:putative tryptophan/tyrosine transport system substrate-binding protein